MAIKIQLSNSNGIKLFTKGTYVDDDIYVYFEEEENKETQLLNNTMKEITLYNSKIRPCAFRSCTSLQSVSFPMCSYIDDYAFESCTSLQSISFPMCSYIGQDAFYNCRSLQNISFPMCSYIGQDAFYNCSSLQEVSFPMCRRIGSYAFRSCTSLQEVSFPMCRRIGQYAFKSCTSLESVYLNVSSVPQLNDIDAFTETPLSNSSYLGRYGSIYVPTSLYEAFCSATNWATYSQRIVSYDFE